MPASVATPVARQNRSKLAPTSCQAPSTIAAGSIAADVVNFYMALLSFVDSAPRAYRLKAGNACSPFSTSTGTSPRTDAEFQNSLIGRRPPSTHRLDRHCLPGVGVKPCAAPHRTNKMPSVGTGALGSQFKWHEPFELAP